MQSWDIPSEGSEVAEEVAEASTMGFYAKRADVVEAFFFTLSDVANRPGWWMRAAADGKVSTSPTHAEVKTVNGLVVVKDNMWVVLDNQSPLGLSVSVYSPEDFHRQYATIETVADAPERS